MLNLSASPIYRGFCEAFKDRHSPAQSTHSGYLTHFGGLAQHKLRIRFLNVHRCIIKKLSKWVDKTLNIYFPLTKTVYVINDGIYALKLNGLATSLNKRRKQLFLSPALVKIIGVL